MRPRHLVTLATAPCVAAFSIVGPLDRTMMGANDVWQRSRALYASLGSYADTGVVVKEYGASGKERHTFTSLFNRAPRRFYFEFNKQGGDRYVIWADAGAFHTWWKATGQRFDYPNPDNLPALNLSGPQTASASSKIPSLLYAKAPTLSDFANFRDAKTTGPEDVSGRACYRIAGTTSDSYAATGKEIDMRQMTVWVDAESLLLRKVVEEHRALPGQIDRVTTTFEAQANPKLDDSRFSFTPPEVK